jgi:hypothetical protein
MFVAPFLDASLFRTVLEVFLKPIEGTMLVKSKRYLKLEAGSGKTVISKDRYKGWDPNSLKKMATSQAFFKEMMETITLLDDRLNNFKMLYRTLWMDAFQKKKAYQTALEKVFEEDNCNELVGNILKKKSSEKWTGNEITESDFKELKPHILDPSLFATLGTTISERVQKILPAALSFGEAVHSLHKHFDTFTHLFDDVDYHADYINKSMKKAFAFAIGNLDSRPDDLKKLIKDPKPDKTFTTEMRAFKRQVAAVFMSYVAVHPDHQENSYIKVGYRPEQVTAKKVIDTFMWNKFLDDMDKWTMHPFLKSFVDNLTDGLKDASDVKGWKELFGEKEVWNDRKGGQILFSDDENSTVNLDGGAMSLEQQSQSYNMDKLKQLLAGLD